MEGVKINWGAAYIGRPMVIILVLQDYYTKPKTVLESGRYDIKRFYGKVTLVIG